MKGCFDFHWPEFSKKGRNFQTQKKEKHNEDLLESCNSEILFGYPCLLGKCHYKFLRTRKPKSNYQDKDRTIMMLARQKFSEGSERKE